MTDVVVDSQRFGNGPRVQSRGTVIAKPYSMVIEEGALINVAGFFETYPGAPITLDLESLPAGNAWDIRLEVDGLVIERLVAPVEGDPVNLADLPNLDRNTLDPEPDAVPVWLEAIDTAIEPLQRKDELDGDSAGLVGVPASELALAVAANQLAGLTDPGARRDAVDARVVAVAAPIATARAVALSIALGG